MSTIASPAPTARGARPHVLGILLASLLAGCSASPPEQPDTAAESSGAPNVVVVLIDTFRPDHLGVLGYDRSTAPFLEGVLRDSTVFHRAFSTSSWTAPSTSSVFTSLYPPEHGVTEGFLAHGRRSNAIDELVGQTLTLNRLPDSIPTLPEIFAEAGYSTWGAATNINIGSQIGFDRGFDRFEYLVDRSARVVERKVSSWQRQMDASSPSFLYLHFNDVHEPYQARRPWYEPADDELADTVARYDSEISFLDDVLQDLYTDLGWGENTLLVVISDHGEEFGEHGAVGHQFTLYDELMRVLFAVHGPDLGIGPARLDHVNVSLIDVLPTVLDLVGIEAPPHARGVSLAPLVRGARAQQVERYLQDRTLFAHRMRYRVRQGKDPSHLWAAVRGPWKLIVDEKRARLFDHRSDPEEKSDRATESEDVARELSQELGSLVEAGIRRPEATADVVLDAETLERLKSLGYVQ